MDPPLTEAKLLPMDFRCFPLNRCDLAPFRCAPLGTICHLEQSTAADVRRPTCDVPPCDRLATADLRLATVKLRRMGFRGKIVVVTGATSGIGRAAAEAFARDHASIVLVGRNESVLNEVSGVVRAAGG